MILQVINQIKLIKLLKRAQRLRQRYELFDRAYLHCSQDRMFKFSSAALECAIEHDTIAAQIASLDPNKSIELIIKG